MTTTAEKTLQEMNTRKYIFLVGGTVLEVQLMTSGSDAVAYCKEKYPAGYCVVVVSGENEEKSPDVGIYR